MRVLYGGCFSRNFYKKLPVLFLASALALQAPTSCYAQENAEAAAFSEEQGTISAPEDNKSSRVFCYAESPEPVTDEKIETLFAQLETSLPTDNGTWSVYVCDLVNETEDVINDQSMQAASLIKLYIMGAVYEDYTNLTAQYGQETVDSYLNSMITVSDNDAANALVGYLGNGDSTAGMSVVNNFCRNHGYTATSMGRLLLASNEFGDNYTSVSDCGHFLKEIYQNDTEEFPYAESMFSLLAAQTRRNKIPAQMPEDVHIANKTGELSDVENDAGIIYDSSNDLVIVFMSENLSGAGEAQNSIASLSRQIYDYYLQ